MPVQVAISCNWTWGFSRFNRNIRSMVFVISSKVSVGNLLDREGRGKLSRERADALPIPKLPADKLPLTRLDAKGILRRLGAGRSRSGNSWMIAWTLCLSTLRCPRKSGME